MTFASPPTKALVWFTFAWSLCDPQTSSTYMSSFRKGWFSSGITFLLVIFQWLHPFHITFIYLSFIIYYNFVNNIADNLNQSIELIFTPFRERKRRLTRAAEVLQITIVHSLIAQTF
ncbi:hypothetical protein MUK42_09020 [Musa troglodytarum]|uniref:Uncharacterized protein n=1 Tax=Musa troglodytarum TaxID=320322 RepID=A0A9E7IGY3_9LILI|nr:hypothetical protein MUK42_09020 [Musa troglodytarum]